jgi:hypothetical protein
MRSRSRPTSRRGSALSRSSATVLAVEADGLGELAARCRRAVANGWHLDPDAAPEHERALARDLALAAAQLLQYAAEGRYWATLAREATAGGMTAALDGYTVLAYGQEGMAAAAERISAA